MLVQQSFWQKFESRNLKPTNEKDHEAFKKRLTKFGSGSRVKHTFLRVSYKGYFVRTRLSFSSEKCSGFYLFVYAQVSPRREANTEHIGTPIQFL